MNHSLFHILGCAIPIAIAFILPAFGVSSGVTLTIFFILMFGCHLMMMGSHSKEGSPSTAKNENEDAK